MKGMKITDGFNMTELTDEQKEECVRIVEQVAKTMNFAWRHLPGSGTGSIETRTRLREHGGALQPILANAKGATE